MKKFTFLGIFLIQSVLASDLYVRLPNQQEILSLLSQHIRSWSEITLKDLSQDLAQKTYSQASLNKYLVTRMFGDTHTTCPELSNAAEAIISKGSTIILLTN